MCGLELAAQAGVPTMSVCTATRMHAACTSIWRAPVRTWYLCVYERMCSDMH